MRFVKKFYPTSFTPHEYAIRVVEWVVSVCTLVGGLYLFTPLYDISRATSAPSALTMTLSHPASITFWGLLLLVGAILAIVGIVSNTPQLKSIGWFAIFLARFFQILTTFLVAGFLPLSWIYPFTVTLVVVVLYGLARAEVYKRATS